jgi:hypothetical protein
MQEIGSLRAEVRSLRDEVRAQLSDKI